MTNFLNAIATEFNAEYGNKQFKSDTGPISFAEFITGYFNDCNESMDDDELATELDTWVRDVLVDNVI